MCEKPISVDVLATEDVIHKALSKPELKFLVPFSRRCEYPRSDRWLPDSNFIQMTDHTNMSSDWLRRARSEISML